MEEICHIVALTSYTNEKVIEECLLVGMKEVLNKPLDFKTLHRVMWKYFHRVDPEKYNVIYK
jgi:CheY-like chemotaxis protein